MFYTDVKLFEDQKKSDAVLDDISCMLGCTRSSLNGVCGAPYLLALCACP